MIRVIEVNKNIVLKVIQVAIVASLILGCEKKSDTEVSPWKLPEDIPNRFLTYLNTQAPLNSGDYQIVPATLLPNQSGNYDITVSHSEVELMTISGNWQDSVGLGVDGNPSHDITVDSPGGIAITLESDVQAELYIVKNNSIVFQATSESGIAEIALEDSYISSVKYAEAYYQAVDPNNTRTNLKDWQVTNGFDSGEVRHVIFRDTKDLGYGRDMYLKEGEDGRFAIYVNNFVVAIAPGNPTNYGPINVEAAVSQDFDFMLGTNAIEFSPIDEADPDSMKIAKFFTFSAPNDEGIQERLTSANLDGRGIKHMPTMCLVCHGGKMLPLNEDGTFNEISLRSAKLNQLEIDTFEFSQQSGWHREDLEADMKLINKLIRDSFVETNSRPLDQKARWDGNFAIELAEMRYGGSDFAADQFTPAVPEGWRQSEFRPDGVELLYSEVIEPHCISCHSLRGHSAGNDEDVVPITVNGQTVNLGNAINFSNYEKFISYSDLIIEYVYRRGVMPLSLRNYEKFWQNPDGVPSLLASFLPDFDVLNESGRIEPPGRPVMLPGGSITAKSPVNFNARGSYFIESTDDLDIAWTLTDGPVGANAEFSNSTGPLTTFTADLDGQYLIELTGANSRSNREVSSFKVTIDNGLASHQTELTFVDDIVPILQNTNFSGRTCSSCHIPDGDFPGIPVYYDLSNEKLYQDILARIDFNDPVNSMLIRKPSRNQHGGGKRIDTNTVLGRQVYSTIINWIKEGAVCGESEFYCTPSD